MLTDSEIAALKLPAGKSRIKRSDGKGLAIWVERGGKRWYVRTPKGSDIAIERGEFPAMNVEAARHERDILLAMIARGVDPVALRRDNKAKPGRRARAGRANAQTTFLHLAEEFVEFQKAEGARPATLEKYRFLIGQLKALHARPAGELTVKVLADVFARIAAKRDRRETAKRAAIFCSQILDRAASTTDLGEAPAFAARLARRGLPKVETENHAAIVDPDRFGELLRAVDAYSGRSTAAREALKLMAYLFPRPGELRQMRWTDVDLAKRTWLIPSEFAKSKRVHRVPLSRQAVAILKGVEWLRINDYVFPGERSGRPMSENTLGAALAVLGFREEHSAHGFRASAKTFLHKSLSVPRDIVELCLGHRLGDMTEQAYMRDTDDTYLIAERAAAMQKYADYLDSLRQAHG